MGNILFSIITLSYGIWNLPDNLAPSPKFILNDVSFNPNPTTYLIVGVGYHTVVLNQNKSNTK